MNEPDGGRIWIDKINCATVSDMNAERDPALFCNETIAPGEMFVRLDWSIDNCNLVPVDLLSCEQRPITDADCVTNFAMSCVKSAECFFFVMRNIDAWNSLGEDVPANSARVDRGKSLDGKSFCRHEIERLEHDPLPLFRRCAGTFARGCCPTAGIVDLRF